MRTDSRGRGERKEEKEPKLAPQAARRLDRAKPRDLSDEQPPRRKDNRKPWNKLDVRLELYISPELKMRLGLPHRTTEEVLEEKRKDEES